MDGKILRFCVINPFYSGDGATYLVLSHDSLVGRTQEPVEYAFYLYELNLRTMQWTRAAVVGSDVSSIANYENFVKNARKLLIGY